MQSFVARLLISFKTFSSSVIYIQGITPTQIVSGAYTAGVKHRSSEFPREIEQFVQWYNKGTLLKGEVAEAVLK